MAQNETAPELKLRILELQYQECWNYSRFYIGVRFTLVASFVTLFIVLIGGYHYVWTAQKAFGRGWPYLLTAIALFGVTMSCAAWMIERRNIYLYREADRLETELETKMGIVGGLSQTLTRYAARERILGVPITHTIAITIVYDTVLVIWTTLLIYSIAKAAH